ncbi:MAG: hypothetical protein M3Q32_02585 [Pseudomonadota bacterium]|nr:hypothetical protein [Pseudomonadota bacterium]
MQLLGGHNVRAPRRFDDVRQAVRRELGVVAFFGDRAIQLSNARGVENALVELDGIIVKAISEGRQCALNQIPRLIVVR